MLFFLTRPFAILMVSGFLLFTACTGPSRGAIDTPPTNDPFVIRQVLDILDPDGDVRFQGTVIENNPGCEADGVCFLQVRLDVYALMVIYHYGEWPLCDNVEATLQGFEVAKGDDIEILGMISEENIISTCESEAYYIRKVLKQ